MTDFDVSVLVIRFKYYSGNILYWFLAIKEKKYCVVERFGVSVKPDASIRITVQVTRKKEHDLSTGDLS